MICSVNLRIDLMKKLDILLQILYLPVISYQKQRASSLPEVHVEFRGLPLDPADQLITVNMVDIFIIFLRILPCRSKKFGT